VRLLSDQIYNVQLGAAELADLFAEYRGSYLLTFAGYNAGRGRVKEWIAKHGDPRDPKVDPVDWVEQIRFAENAQLRAARAREPAGLPRALRRQREAPHS
jgi:soluble lytic murein transglycosylase